MEVYMYSFTFKNGDVLELKAIKHAEFASHETHCYEATVYFNKKTIGWVNNDGFGGSDTFNAKEPFNLEIIRKQTRRRAPTRAFRMG